MAVSTCAICADAKFADVGEEVSTLSFFFESSELKLAELTVGVWAEFNAGDGDAGGESDCAGRAAGRAPVAGT